MSFKFPVSNTTAAQHWRLWCFSPYECINPFCTDSNNLCTGIWLFKVKGMPPYKTTKNANPCSMMVIIFHQYPVRLRGCLVNGSRCCHGLLLITRRETLCKCDLCLPHKLTYPPYPCTIGYFQKSTFFLVHTSYRFQIFFLAVDQLRPVLLSAVSVVAELTLQIRNKGRQPSRRNWCKHNPHDAHSSEL
jgi:hypothetical protein